MTEPQPTREQEIALARERAKRTLPLIGFVLLGLIAITMPLPRRFVAALPLLVAAYLSVQLLRFLKDRPTSEKLTEWLAAQLPADIAVARAWQAMLAGKPIRRTPWTVGLASVLKGVLPRPVWDVVADRVFHVYSSMDEFTGRTESRRAPQPADDTSVA